MGNPFLKKNPYLTILTLTNTILIVGFFLVFTAGAFFAYPLMKDHPKVLALKNRVLTLLDLSYLLYAPASASLPIYDLQIKQKDLEALEKSIPKEGKWWVRQEGDKASDVPARFLFKGNEHKAKARYRGDMENHWRFAKKSWRVKFQKDNLFEGMRSINLIIPEDRYYFIEHVNNRIAEKLGLVVPRSRFVILRLNGAFQGAYFEVEQWGKEFMEHRQQPDVNLYGEEDRDLNLRERGLIDDEIYTDIGFWKKYTADRVFDFDNYGELDELLEFLNQSPDDEFKRLLPQIVNLENFYRWQAHSEIAGSHHQNFWHNLRLYFNNRSGQFEFIPWDVLTEETPGVDIHYNPLVTRVLSIPEFFHGRNLVLWDYVKDDQNLADDLKFFDETFRSIRHAFLSDRRKRFSNVQFLEDVKKMRETILRNRKLLKENLAFSRVFVNLRFGMSERVRGADASLVAGLELVSDGYSAAELERLSVTFPQPAESLNQVDIYQDRNGNREWDSEDTLWISLEKKSPALFEKSDLGAFAFSLRKYDRTRLQNYKQLIKPEASRAQFFVVARPPFLGKSFPQFELALHNAVTGAPIRPIVHLSDRSAFRDLAQAVEDRASFLSRWPIFQAKGATGVRLPAGIYDIPQTFIIPKGMEVTIEPGVTLRFAAGVSAYSYSPLSAAGSSAQPIVFTAADPSKPWGVFAVINTLPLESRFEFCTIEYGGEGYVHGIRATGALALHYSAATVRECRFLRNTGDDAINIKNGKAAITRSRFIENKFDAVDYDFSTGRVMDNIFERNGNDGVDLAGSTVQVIGNRIQLSGDKGVSAGENSTPVIFNNLFLQNNIGIALKDLTLGKIINNTLVKNNVGIAMYQKKAVFGQASAYIYNTLIWDNKTNLEITNKTHLSIHHSDIQNGFEGKQVMNLKPVFKSEESGDFRLEDVESNRALLRGGTPDPVKDLWPGVKDQFVSIGILNLPFQGDSVTKD